MRYAISSGRRAVRLAGGAPAPTRSTANQATATRVLPGAWWYAGTSVPARYATTVASSCWSWQPTTEELPLPRPPAASPRCAARASPARRRRRTQTVRAANRQSEPGHVPHSLAHGSSHPTNGRCSADFLAAAPLARPVTWDQSSKRGTASSLTFSIARAPLAGSVATTTRSELTEGRMMSMVSAVLHDQEAPPTVDSSDAGEPSVAESNRGARWAVQRTATESPPQPSPHPTRPPSLHTVTTHPPSPTSTRTTAALLPTFRRHHPRR